MVITLADANVSPPAEVRQVEHGSDSAAALKQLGIVLPPQPDRGPESPSAPVASALAVAHLPALDHRAPSELRPQELLQRARELCELINPSDGVTSQLAATELKNMLFKAPLELPLHALAAQTAFDLLLTRNKSIDPSLRGAIALDLLRSISRDAQWIVASSPRLCTQVEAYLSAKAHRTDPFVEYEVGYFLGSQHALPQNTYMEIMQPTYKLRGKSSSHMWNGYASGLCWERLDYEQACKFYFDHPTPGVAFAIARSLAEGPQANSSRALTRFLDEVENSKDEASRQMISYYYARYGAFSNKRD